MLLRWNGNARGLMRMRRKVGTRGAAAAAAEVPY